jgi:hypothetical protein
MVPPTFRLVLREELAAKQRERVATGIAHLRTLATTNPIENLNSAARRVCGRGHALARWRDDRALDGRRDV